MFLSYQDKLNTIVWKYTPAGLTNIDSVKSIILGRDLERMEVLVVYVLVVMMEVVVVLFVAVELVGVVIGMVLLKRSPIKLKQSDNLCVFCELSMYFFFFYLYLFNS